MPSRTILHGKSQQCFALAALVICLLSSHAAIAAVPFVVKSLALYQPNDVLVARLGADAAPLGSYVKQIEARESALFASSTKHPGVSGAIVIAIKPGRQSRAWLVLGSSEIPASLALQVTTEAEVVFPVSVRLGPIAVAIMFDAWGGGQPVTDREHPAPLPLEWRRTSAREVIPDGPLARVWP